MITSKCYTAAFDRAKLARLGHAKSRASYPGRSCPRAIVSRSARRPLYSPRGARHMAPRPTETRDWREPFMRRGWRIAGMTVSGLALALLIGTALGTGGYTAWYAEGFSYLSDDPA